MWWWSVLALRGWWCDCQGSGPDIKQLFCVTEGQGEGVNFGSGLCDVYEWSQMHRNNQLLSDLNIQPF